MHCPACGKPATTEQQFCRTCGMSLEEVGRLVEKQFPAPTKSEMTIETNVEPAIVRRMFNWILCGVIIFGLGAALAVVDSYYDLPRWFSLLSAALVLAGAGVGVVGVLNGIKQGASVSGKRSAPESDETKSLPTQRLPVSLPSVTERTTQSISQEEVHLKAPIDSNRRE